MQTRKGNLFEVCCNTATGFVVAWSLTQWLFPTVYHLNLNYGQSWTITFIYTVVSVIRSYIWRRIFNFFIVKKGVLKKAM